MYNYCNMSDYSRRNIAKMIADALNPDPSKKHKIGESINYYDYIPKEGLDPNDELKKLLNINLDENTKTDIIALLLKHKCSKNEMIVICNIDKINNIQYQNAVCVVDNGPEITAVPI